MVKKKEKIDDVQFLNGIAPEVYFGRIEDELNAGNFDDALMLLDFLGWNHGDSDYFDEEVHLSKLLDIMFVTPMKHFNLRKINKIDDAMLRSVEIIYIHSIMLRLSFHWRKFLKLLCEKKKERKKETIYQEFLSQEHFGMGLLRTVIKVTIRMLLKLQFDLEEDMKIFIRKKEEDKTKTEEEKRILHIIQKMIETAK